MKIFFKIVPDEYY